MRSFIRRVIFHSAETFIYVNGSLIGNEANSWHAFMTNQTDNILLLKLDQSVSELSLLDLLIVTYKTSLGFRHQIVVQVHVLDAILGHFVTEILLDPLDVVADDLDAGIGCERDTCRYNVHIDLSCLRVRRRLLHGCADQADAFLDILLFNSVTEAHFGERFCDTDE